MDDFGDFLPVFFILLGIIIFLVISALIFFLRKKWKKTTNLGRMMIIYSNYLNFKLIIYTKI